MINEFPQVMTIAGSDCDGSAGMQADMNTFFAHDVYGISILTSCVAGNSYGIQKAQDLDIDFIEQEFKSIADDFKVRATKTGMLSNDLIINTVVKNLQHYDFGKLVVDPVILTKHGNKLLTDNSFSALKNILIPLADVITPNFSEAEILTDICIKKEDDIRKVGKLLKKLGAKNVIIKGKHEGSEDVVRDYILLENDDEFWLEHQYIKTNRINGTGDTLSASIVANIAKGKDIKTAIILAHNYTYKCIKNEIEVGHKFGPINHWA